ncbi:MAG: diguanylate cyclase [Planctomycetota bacterium]
MNQEARSAAGRVLLVDDSPSVQRVIRDTLLRDGHDVETCGSLAAALQRLENAHFPVVITDLLLPDGDGITVLQRSLQLYPRSSVIVITGDSRFDGAARAIQHGAFGYLPKPFGPARIRHLVRLALERADLRSQVEHYRTMAMTDPLTRLGNRRRFEQALDEEIARAHRFSHPLSLLMVDIDDLEACNHEHGRVAGDERVRHVAAVLAGAVRKVDRVTRYGGDEFAVLLPETPEEGAVTAAGRYCLVAGEIQDPPDTRASLSIGWATYPDRAATAGELVRLADDGMRAAKRAGGGRYHPE